METTAVGLLTLRYGIDIVRRASVLKRTHRFGSDKFAEWLDDHG
jgi:hypothetical protein